MAISLGSALSSTARAGRRAIAYGARLQLDSARLWGQTLLSGERMARRLLLGQPDAPGTESGGGGSAQADRSGAAALERLLTRSLEQSAAESRAELFDRLLAELVPDEARILAALADDPAVPLVHVESLPGRRVLESATLLGNAAGLTLPGHAATYVQRLEMLGLVETGPEAKERDTDYEVLLATGAVRRALKAGAGPVPARALRRSLVLSPLGRELWEWCQAGGRTE